MAFAEARAAWQRTANRYMVQEDAKRAPKLACCPSASPSIKQVDAGTTNAANPRDVSGVGFLPSNQNSSYSSLSPSSKWWLQRHPNYSCHRGFVHDQVNIVEEMESFQSGGSSGTELPNCEDGGTFFYESLDPESFVDSHFRSPTTCVKSDGGGGKQGLKPIYTPNSQDPSKLGNTGDLSALTDTGPDTCPSSKEANEPLFDPQTPWIGGEKSEPWWRTADRDALALMVAQRSCGLIENCDLPQPQRSQMREPFIEPYCLDYNGICVSSIDQKHPGSQCVLPVRNQALASVDRHCQSVAVNPGSDSTIQETVSMRVSPENDPGKAQLLDALRHSQTRAREAEMAAQQAYAEKEDVVKLVFRQASQLFAYKQWFQLLQLENLYFQIKNNQKEPISTIFPVMFPWMPQKTRKLQKNSQKAAKGKQAKRGCPIPRCDFNKYAVVFALGLSLVGAGLFLGWTVGWMLPTF